jgi:hypothetical protein
VKTQIYINARIYTFETPHSMAQAIAVENGRILAVGRNEALQQEFAGRAVFEDLHNQVILPGLTDAHIHLQHYALSLQKVDCETATLQECLQRVAKRARQAKPGEWVLGHGWNQNNWAEGFGNASLLDEAAPNNPVYLTAKSLHAGWANSSALSKAGLQSHSPDPEGGRLGRDASGTLDGILFESAMEFIHRILPAPGVEEVERAILAALPNLWRCGLTGVHDFDRRVCFAALQHMHQEGRLKLRVTKSIPWEDLNLAAGLGLRTGFGDDFLRIGSVKAFADGALGPQTAAMLQPYEDDPDNRGILMLDSEELYEKGRQAVECGLSLAVHAIGDRANHEVLDAFEQLRQYERELPVVANQLRHRIEHVQVIHPDDAGRLGALGVIASMQPIHAASDMLMADRYWGKRAAYSYAWQTQAQAGAQLAFGSDAPVESPNPFWGIHAAVTRQRQDGAPGPQGWYPEQRLSVFEALQGYTRGAAFAGGVEDRLGMLKPGYFADLIVLDQDPFEIPAQQLAELKPTATMIHGEWVNRS